MRSRRRWSSGRAKACRPIRGRGWFRPGGSRRSMRCAGGRGSMLRWRALAERLDTETPDAVAAVDDEGIEDDRLRLIFTCCHPALPPEARVALTLREVCGLTTEEIARAFLTAAAHAGAADRAGQGEDQERGHSLSGAVASRFARSAGHGAAGDLPRVQRRIFGVVGRIGDAGRSVGRGDSPGAAAGRVAEPEPEVMGLLALMLLQESRRAARTSPTGELVLLEDQDRSLWNREQIAEGLALVRQALPVRRVGPYSVQAAIAAVHAEARRAAATDWAQIVRAVRRAGARSRRRRWSS